MSSKYEPLGAYLENRPATEVPMSFSEIEAVIGRPLPPRAVNHPAWWSNNTSNNTMTRVWLEAGFRTERVDISGRRLIFRRVGRPARPPVAPAHSGGLLARVRAALAGTVRIAPNVSLTAPTDEAWDAEQL
jgi:hypothetical protein